MTWRCARCDTVNEAISASCVVCGARHAPSATATSPSGGEPTQLWSAPPAGQAAEPATWCDACGSAVAPGLRYCGRCGADQFAPPTAGLTSAAAPTAPPPATAGVRRPPAPPPHELYGPTPTGPGRVIAAVLGVLFVAVIAGVAAFVLASRSTNTAAPPSTQSERTSGNVNAGTSSTSTSTSSSSSTSSTSAVTSTTAVGSSTTIAGGPTTTVAGGRGPFAPPGASATDLAALDLAQQLATALATKDAAALARLQPGKSAAGYEDLRASTAILKQVTPVRDKVYSLRLGLVAHEKTDDEHSHVYCVTWTVDLDAGRVTETGQGTTASPQYAGWVDPATMVDYVRTTC